MFIYVFESWDNYDGQHGVAIVSAKSEDAARSLMGRASKVRDWSIENKLWSLEATIPSSAVKENIYYSIYL